MIRARLTKDMKDAMKARDKERLSTLRLISAAIKDRDIASRGDEGSEGVDEAEIRQLLTKMIKQRQDSAEAYDEAGRIELAERERSEIEVIRTFLPKPLSDADVQQAIQSAITETGANSIRDMGRIMGVLKSRHAGQMDFAKVGAQVKSQLG